MLHRVIVGAPAASDEPQCEHETAERTRDSQETDGAQQLEETEEPRAFGDLRRREGLRLVEPPPGRLAAGWDAVREALSGSAAVRRVGAAAAVLVPLALIAFVVAGQLSGSSARNFARTARPIAGAPSRVRAPVSLTPPSGRILRKQRPSARVRRHRAGRRPSASTALRVRSPKRHASGSPSATASSSSPPISPAPSYTRPPSYTASYRPAPSVSGNAGASSGHTAGIASGGGSSGGGGSSSPSSGSGTRNFGQGGAVAAGTSPNG